MANLTITVDDELLRRARARAAAAGTSVNAVLRESLAAWTGGDDERARAVASLLDRSRRARSRRGRARWSRDVLHER